MEITIENTDKVVTFEVNGAEVPARIWQGQTSTGIPVQVFVTRIAPEVPRDDPKNAQFVNELQECAPPRVTVQEIPLRMIL